MFFYLYSIVIYWFAFTVMCVTTAECLEMFQRLSVRQKSNCHSTYTYYSISMFAHFRVITIITLLNYLFDMLKCKAFKMFCWQSIYTLPNVCAHQQKLLSHSLRTVCHIKLKHQEKC